eukprot:COSAG02_NODE_41115_length_398_cov_0.675585_1_plen_73_part_10
MRREEEIAQKKSSELLADLCRRTKTALCEVMRHCALIFNDTHMNALPTFDHVDALLDGRLDDAYSPIKEYGQT